VLTVGENANISGEIKAKAVTVYGKVQGNITVAERCELKWKSTQGDLHATRLLIEDGATFIGNSEVTSGMSHDGPFLRWSGPITQSGSKWEVVRSLLGAVWRPAADFAECQFACP
jgi:hypothetical protein